MPERPLHAAVDGRELLGKPTGVGRYVAEVLRDWAGRADELRVSVIVPEAPDERTRALGGALQWHVAESRHRGTRWEQTVLPRALTQVAPDVFLAPANTAPLRRPCPMAVVIHDVSFFAHPEWFSRREGFRRRLLTRTAARRADAILTVSEFSRTEIARYLRIAEADITVASPGAPPVQSDSGSDRPPVVLYVGSLFNRRRPEIMLEAFRLVRAERADARLILAGDNRTMPHVDPRAMANELGISAAVEWREYVDEKALLELYRTAGAFLFLSDYEGFGITPLEALAHHVPSVVLDLPISREVYGDGALRVPCEPPAIARALLQLLGDPAVRQRVLNAGYDRLAQYRWSSTATSILSVLRRIAP